MSSILKLNDCRLGGRKFCMFIPSALPKGVWDFDLIDMKNITKTICMLWNVSWFHLCIKAVRWSVIMTEKNLLLCSELVFLFPLVWLPPTNIWVALPQSEEGHCSPDMWTLGSIKENTYVGWGHLDEVDLFNYIWHCSRKISWNTIKCIKCVCVHVWTICFNMWCEALLFFFFHCTCKSGLFCHHRIKML